MVHSTMDNGYLLLNKVKIPHVNMLAKFSSVDLNTNKYVRPASASLVYGTLTFVRSTIVLQSGGVLARGVTIATRYAAVRRQFQDRDAKEWETGENQVLNYTMVQIRLLPLLAATFALHFTGRGMMALYQENQDRMAADVGKASSDKRSAGPEELHPGADLLADLHATSCGLKAFASTTAAEGLEVCRRACGGHGYSSFSGIGSWYADYLPTTTWEGDNYMLTQQVARYVSIPITKPRLLILNPPSSSSPRAPSSPAPRPPTIRLASFTPSFRAVTSAPPSTFSAVTKTSSLPSLGAPPSSHSKPSNTATRISSRGTASSSTSGASAPPSRNISS